MPAQQRLSDAIEAFMSSRKANGIAATTLKTQRGFLMRFLTITGNIYLASIDDTHIDRFLTEVDWWEPTTINLMRSHLRTFFAFCRGRGWMRTNYDPMANTRHRREIRRPRFRIGVDDFDRAMDLAEESHPRDRMITALGLFLFLRASEIKTLRCGDVHLDQGEIRVTVHKSGLVDDMPITQQLDAELRRWLTYYTQQVGPIRDDYYLVPALKPMPGIYDRNLGHLVNVEGRDSLLAPERALQHPERPVQRMLVKGEWPIQREGCHTLRRSGARALFDELCDRGFDRALEIVSSMLHHERMSTTQLYLGITETKHRRDDLLKGRSMFRRNDNVIRLAATGSGGAR